MPIENLRHRFSLQSQGSVCNWSGGARVDDRSLSANSIMDPQELIMLMSVARAYP